MNNVYGQSISWERRVWRPRPLDWHLSLQEKRIRLFLELGRFGTSQGNQLGFLLAIEDSANGWRRSWLATQHSLEAFFHQLTSPPRYFSRYFFLGGVATFVSEGADAATFGFSFFGFLTSWLLRT